MFAQINHIAIISDQYAMLSAFYQTLFDLTPSARKHGSRTGFNFIAAGDGYVGFNFLPRRDGYVGGIDHFGMVVDSIDLVAERMQRFTSNAAVVKRPSERPFADLSGNDPDGNIFDLAQKDSRNLAGVHKDNAESDYQTERTRYANRYAIRTLNTEQVAEFYATVFELQPVNRKEGDENYHLTDGRMTLSIMPWKIDKFRGMSIKRPGPDHIGFHVESVESFKKEAQDLAGANTYMAPRALGGSKESNVRKQLFVGSALGGYQMADNDGNWIDVSEV
ncbi:MAG TPA: VOC family protein [Stellaceae bacterium]|jgi:predicted enzyme related to lactoylglutathione lyase